MLCDKSWLWNYDEDYDEEYYLDILWLKILVAFFILEFMCKV